MKLSVHVKEKAKSAPSDQDPVIDLTQFGYVKLLGKGMLPEGQPVVMKSMLVSKTSIPEGQPVVMKSMLVSKTADKKNKEAGRAVMLTA